MTTTNINTTVATVLFSSDGLAAIQESIEALCAKAEKYKAHNPGKPMPVTKDAVLLDALQNLGVELSESEAEAVLEITRETVTTIIALGACPGYVMKRGQFGGIQREGWEPPKTAAKEKAASVKVPAATRLAQLQGL